MFVEILLILGAMAAGGGSGKTQSETTQTQTTQPVASAAPALVAEDQTPTGQFTTATEIKPILTATRMNWMAIRDFNGQDLLYVTHLWAWRCGLVRVELAVNGGAFEDWPLPACHTGTAQPNAITDRDGLPYRGYARGSLDQVAVRITYDDLTTDEITFERSQILMP